MGDEPEPFDRQAAWQRAWGDTTWWATNKLLGVLAVGSGSLLATAWVAIIAARHGHPANRARHLASTQWPILAQVIFAVLAFVTGGFLAFLALVGARFTVTARRQRNEARDAVDLEREARRSEREAAATALAKKPIHSIHETNLRGSFSYLIRSVGNNEEIRYGDPDRPVLGPTFAIHFPECAEAIRGYEASREAQAAALVTYEERFAALAIERGFDEPPYLRPEARNMVWAVLRRAVRGEEFDDLDWQHGDAGREFRVFSRTHTWPVTESVSDEQFETVKADLKTLFIDGLVMREAGAFTEAQTARYQATIAALRRFDACRDLPIARRDDCSQCQDH